MAGVDGLIAAVRDALRRGEPYSRWLIVFDNADQPEEIADLIPAGSGDVLITSRNHRWEAVIRTVPMDVFRPGESREFLLKRVRKGLTEADADRLAKELGHLPASATRGASSDPEVVGHHYVIGADGVYGPHTDLLFGTAIASDGRYYTGWHRHPHGTELAEFERRADIPLV